jgi:hypothetical protein
MLQTFLWDFHRNLAGIAGVQVTNTAKTRLGLWACVQVYNQGWSLERDFHIVKDQPLGIQPLYVREEEQIEGLTRLLIIALRIRHFSLIPTSYAAVFILLVLGCGGERFPDCFAFLSVVVVSAACCQ